MTDPLIGPIEGKLRAIVVRGFARHHLPGAVVGVVRGDDLVWCEGFGFADIASGRRPDVDTVFRVASISKTVTATAILQLRDAGKLRLDDPLVQYIPEFWAVSCAFAPIEAITLRRLLIHHSGLVTEGPFDYWHSMEFPTMEQILARLPQTAVVIAPDSASKYGNLAYALLGEVVARVAGLPHAEYVRTHIFAPLAMDSSSFGPAAELLARKAIGYDEHPYDDDPPPVRHTETHGIAAAAGLYTTTHDLAKWLALQFRAAGDAAVAGPDWATTGANGQPAPDGSVLTGHTLAEMHHPQRIDATWTAGNGLGWMSQRRGERIDVGHGGSIHGFISQVQFNVARRLGAIVLTNQGRHSAAAEIAVELIDALAPAFDQAGGDIAREQAPVPTPVAWRPLLGRYRMAGTEVQVECRRGALRLETFPPGGRSLHAPAPLEPTAQPDQFRVTGGRGAGELLTFVPDGSGRITSFTLAGFVYALLLPALPPTAL